MVVEIDKNGELLIIDQNDEIKLKIIGLINVYIEENMNIFQKILENELYLSFYGYLCATIKLVSKANNAKLMNECLNFYVISARYLEKNIWYKIIISKLSLK